MNLLVETGRKRSGKDYLAQALIDNGVRGFSEVIRCSFSDELRILANELYPWCPAFPEDHLKDVPCPHPDNLLGLSPRALWLRLADDNDMSLRKIDGKLLVNRFIARWEDRIINETDKLFVITDLRSADEVAWLDNLRKNIQFVIIRIIDDRNPDVRKASVKEDDFENYLGTIAVDHEYYHTFNDESVFAYIDSVSDMYGK